MSYCSLVISSSGFESRQTRVGLRAYLLCGLRPLYLTSLVLSACICKVGISYGSMSVKAHAKPCAERPGKIDLGVIMGRL